MQMLFNKSHIFLLLHTTLFMWGALPFKYWLFICIITFPWVNRAFEIKFYLRNFFLIIFLFTFLILIYLLCYGNIVLFEEKNLVIFSIFIQAFYLFVILGRVPKFYSHYKNLILSIGFGFFAHGLLTCIYSFYITDKPVGLGTVYNPFYEDGSLGSALISNYLCASALIFYFYLNFKFLKYFLIFICFICSAYLVARSFFIIFFLILLLDIILDIKNSIFRIINLSFILFIFILASYFILENDSFNLYVDSILDSFQDKGTDSLRWNHWNYALNNFYLFPFGGMRVNNSIEDIGSFHNFLIDTYRISGVIGISLISFILIYCFSGLKKDNKSLFIFIGLILIMFQDVIFEGGQKIFFTTFLIPIFYNSYLFINKSSKYL